MKTIKHHLLEEANDGTSGSAGSNAAPSQDISKVVESSFKSLQDEIRKLNSRIDAQAAPKKQEPAASDKEDDLETMILVDPKKAVEKIKSQVKNEVLNTVSSESKAQQDFGAKFQELSQDYPEIANQSSDLHARAKEIMAQTANGQFDAGALERAVLRAAMEKGVLPVKHRKAPVSEDGNDDGYLGGGSSFTESRRESRRGKSEKLPAATLMFAELVGMNVKDPKVVENLSKTYNERKGRWNKYS